MQLETIALDAAPTSSVVSIPAAPALASQPSNAQPVQVGTTETYSDNILGPVGFTLSNLRIAAKKKPAYAVQTPYIERYQPLIAGCDSESELANLENAFVAELVATYLTLWQQRSQPMIQQLNALL